MSVLSELLGAELAREGLLARMQLHVRDQIAERSALLAALPALGLVACMLVHMHQILGACSTSLIAFY